MEDTRCLSAQAQRRYRSKVLVDAKWVIARESPPRGLRVAHVKADEAGCMELIEHGVWRHAAVANQPWVEFKKGVRNGAYLMWNGHEMPNFAAIL